MNTIVANNYAKVKLFLLAVPLIKITAIIVFLYTQNALNTESYTSIQKSSCLFLNAKLSQFPNLQYNLTQIGDAFIALSLLSIFVFYAPKIWEALLSASLISLIFSKVLKAIFKIPRPAALFEHDNLTIIGEKLLGHSSFPSGHSITVFTTITILMFAFVPTLHKNRLLRIAYFLPIVLIGIFISLTRVGVGAHHPIDVVIGSSLGYISGILGIYLSQNYNIWSWISSKKSYLFFIILFLGSSIFLIYKIFTSHLVIFYFPLFSLIISLYTITKAYVKEFNANKK